MNKSIISIQNHSCKRCKLG